MSLSFGLTRSAGIRLAAAATVLLPSLAHAQFHKPNWQNLDLQTDSVLGIGTDRAYKELLGKTHPTKIRVAVIDAGIDVMHEDLKSIIWTNSKEIAGNGKDDDKNGYADDIHGWSFLGGAKGDVGAETLELTRLVKKLQPKYGAVTDTMPLSVIERDSLRMYRAMLADFTQQLTAAQTTLANIQGFATVLNGITTAMGKPTPTLADFQAYQPKNDQETQVKNVMLQNLQGMDFATFKSSQIDAGLEHFKETVDYNLNMNYDSRTTIVGDDPNNDNQHNYGSANVTGPDAMHGTHVAGIIGAVRNNNVGMNGVADDVEIMSVRAVPNGDERDKDIANAIRYAADNGARVVNMSFGKAYSGNKAVVDEAVKYAMSKDVLLIHAAGNDGKNLDRAQNFPTRKYADGSGSAGDVTAKGAWIEVGASGPTDDQSLVASFSNYGKTTVDLFSPGVRIYSTVPGSKYEDLDGTSMATPVVVGAAALIFSRYPQLTAPQVKELLMQSVTRVDHTVMVHGDGAPAAVPFSDVCITGGVVNVYAALKLAAQKYGAQNKLGLAESGATRVAPAPGASPSHAIVGSDLGAPIRCAEVF